MILYSKINQTPWRTVARKGLRFDFKSMVKNSERKCVRPKKKKTCLNLPLGSSLPRRHTLLSSLFMHWNRINSAILSIILRNKLERSYMVGVLISRCKLLYFLCRCEFHGNILRIDQHTAKNSIEKRENDVSIFKQQNNG